MLANQHNNVVRHVAHSLASACLFPFPRTGFGSRRSDNAVGVTLCDLRVALQTIFVLSVLVSISVFAGCGVLTSCFIDSGELCCPTSVRVLVEALLLMVLSLCGYLHVLLYHSELVLHSSSGKASRSRLAVVFLFGSGIMNYADCVCFCDSLVLDSASLCIFQGLVHALLPALARLS